jgi:hypothetical protein
LAAWERNKNGRKNQDFDLLNDPVTDTLRNKIAELMNQDSDVESRESQPLKATIEDKRRILTEEKIKLLRGEVFWLCWSPLIVTLSAALPLYVLQFALALGAGVMTAATLGMSVALIAALAISILVKCTINYISNRIHNKRNLKAVDLIEAALSNKPYQPNNRVSSSLSRTKRAHSESTASSDSSSSYKPLLEGPFREHLEIDQSGQHRSPFI